MNTTECASKPLFSSLRLNFRAFTVSDFDALKSLHQHPDVAISTFTGFSDDVKVLEELNEYRDEYQRLGISQLYASEKDSGRFVGRLGLQYRIWNPTKGEYAYELRFAVHPDFWSQGYASEGAQAILDYAFQTMNLPKVVVAHFDDNVKSALIAKKLGFQETGRFVVKHRIIVGYEQLNPNHHSL